MTKLQLARGAAAAPLLGALLPAALWGQTARLAAVERLVADALRRNAGLEVVRLEAETAAAQARAAGALLLPSLSVESRYSRQDGTLNLGELINPAYAALNELSGAPVFRTDVDLPLPLRHESRLRVVQPLFNGPLWAQRRAAQHASRAAEWQIGRETRALVAEVQTAYLRASSARRAVEVWANALTRVLEAERVSARLVEAGRATPDVLHRARADRAEVEQQLEEARQVAASAARQVNQLSGRPLDAEIEWIDEAALVHELPLTGAEAEASALRRREELKQLESGGWASASAARAAGSSYLPSVAVALDYGAQGREVRFGRAHDYAVASLVVTWNVWDGGAAAARRLAARSQTAAFAARRADAQSRIRLDVLHAYERAVVARGAIGTAEERVRAATRAYELVRRRHDEGVAAQIELIDVRAALTAAELNRSLTIHEYAIRWVDLERAAALRENDTGRNR